MAIGFSAVISNHITLLVPAGLILTYIYMHIWFVRLDQNKNGCQFSEMDKQVLLRIRMKHMILQLHCILYARHCYIGITYDYYWYTVPTIQLISSVPDNSQQLGKDFK